MDRELPTSVADTIETICTQLQYTRSGRSVRRIRARLTAVVRLLLAIENSGYIVNFDLFAESNRYNAKALLVPVEYYQYDVVRSTCAIDCQCTRIRAKQKEWLQEYLVRDVVPIILDYALCHVQRFAVGNPVRMEGTSRFYVSTITHIVALNSFVFFFLRAETFAPSEGDWIPASSPRFECFYSSQGKQIEQGKFITTKPDDMNKLVDVFYDSLVLGRWKIGHWYPGYHAVFAELGTFTS